MTAGKVPLPGQYRISKQEVEGSLNGYRHQEIGDWNIVVDSNLPIHDIISNGERIGYLVGTVLDTHETQRPDDIWIGNTATSRIEAVERRLSRFVGRYVVVARIGGETRMYLDPAGSLPAVYDSEQECVAASPLSIPAVSHEPNFRNDFFERVYGAGNGWIPGRTTYYQGVKRLLPNHYLNLDTWRPVRHWPDASDDVDAPTDVDALVAEIVSEAERVLESVVAEYDRPKMSLTAGKESRCLLAVARQWISNNDLSLYTFEGDQYSLDTHMALRISDDNDLGLVPLTVVEATESQQEQYLRRTGYTVTTENKLIHPTIETLNADVRVEGLGGEVGRGYYWTESDDRQTEITASELLKRFHKPRHDSLVAEMDRWLTEVKGFNAPTVLDLAYQEHRLGCWGGPQHLGLPTDIEYICPFLTPRMIRLMHRLPTEVRKRDVLPSQIVDRTWPDLNEYPYNSFGGHGEWRRYWYLFQAGISDPTAALEFVTKALRQ